MAPSSLEKKILDFCYNNNIRVDVVERANGMSMPSSAPEPGNGRPRSPRYSGAYERCPIGQPTSHHSSWCKGWSLCYPPDAVEEAQKDAIDSLEESRDIIVTRSAGYQQALQRYISLRLHSMKGATGYGRPHRVVGDDN
jgi:hypothetical protein